MRGREDVEVSIGYRTRPGADLDGHHRQLHGSDVKGFGGDWSLPIPIHEVTETAVTFAGLFEASVIGIIEFVTGDMEAVMKMSGKSGKLENFYILKCKPTQRMF